MVNETEQTKELEEELPEEEVDTSTETKEVVEVTISSEDLAKLRADFDKAQGDNLKLFNDLKSSIGRFQSLQARLEEGRGDSTKLREQVNEQVSVVDQTLERLLDGIDESALDPKVRQDITKIRSEYRAKADRASLEAELLEKMRKESAPVVPQRPQVPAVEVEINALIEAADMNPDDFDWSEAATVWQKDGDGALRKYFLGKITEKRTEAEAAERRQTRRTNATRSPNPSSTPDANARLREGNLDDRLKALRELTSNRA